MAEISKQALKVENNTSFPNNNNGAITPTILRTFNVDMIDSLVDEITYQADSGSWNQQIDALEQFTASASGLTTGSLLITASASDNVITFTKGDASTFNVTINNSNLNQFTASANQRLTAIESVSGSWITESETGSFARYNVSNPWSADQTFTNITAVSASFTYVKTLIETASVIYSSGSNQFGDAANDVQTLYGQVRVINALTASGLNYPVADNGAKSFMQTDGAGNLSLQYVDTIWEIVRAGENITKGTPLYISGSQGSNPIVYAADASNPAKMPVTYVAGQAMTANTNYNAIVLGLIEGINLTGYVAGDVIYVAEGGGFTKNLPSGSNSITQVLGVVTKPDSGGKALVLNPGPAALPGLQTGYIWQGNGNNRAVASTTSSFYTGSYTGSFKGDGSNLTGITSSVSLPILDEGVPQGNAVSLNFTGSAISATVVAGIGIISVSGLDSGSFNSYTASNDQRVSSLEAFTSSANTSITNLNSATASLFTSASLSLVTASFDNGTRNLTFTKGDASTFSVNIPDVSGSGGGDFVTTSSFNNYTSSNDQRVSSLETFSGSAEISITNLNLTTASLVTSVSNLNSYTQSTNVRLNNLEGATGSYVTETESGSFLLTASFAAGTLTFTKGDNTTFGVVIPDVSGSAGQSFVIPSLESISGSLVITANGFTSGAANLLHISESSVNVSNLIFKSNNLTSDTIVSGSDNIFSNPAAPTAGFKRFVGSSNLFINSGSVPQITGSIAFPLTINNNFSNGGAISVVGPISASSSTITNNILAVGTINVGTAGANNAEKLVGGFTIASNVVMNSNQTIVANQSAITSSITFSNNQCVAATTIAVSSSAMTIAGNLFNTNGNNIRNAYWSSSIGLGTLTVARNIMQGSTHVILFTGSQPTGTTNAPQIAESQMMGTNITAFVDVAAAEVSGTVANHSIISTMIHGHSMIVTGSSVNTLNNYGSAFFGRNNAQDGNRSKTAQTIFAVGTGTSNTVRKTGFLIDSASNTFVEGTLNISGSSSFTGSVNITGSFTASLANGFTYVGNASGITTTVATSSFIINTGSFATTGSNSFIGAQIIDGNVVVTGSFNLSGSAFVSGNISFHGNSSIQTDSSTGNINVIGGSGGWAALQDSSASNWVWVDNTAAYIGTDQGGAAPTWTFATNGKLSMPGEVDITGTLTASLSDGYVWVGDSSGKTYEVATSSFGGGGGAAFPYTGSALITGSLEMIGPIFGNVITLSVASSTASVDMNAGNMFVLNIPTGSTTHVNVTNIRAGQTMNLLLKQAAGATTGSLSWSPTIKFPSGLDLVPTATGSAVDLVSMLTFDTGSVIAANVKNLS